VLNCQSYYPNLVVNFFPDLVVNFFPSILLLRVSWKQFLSDFFLAFFIAFIRATLISLGTVRLVSQHVLLECEDQNHKVSPAYSRARQFLVLNNP